MISACRQRLRDLPRNQGTHAGLLMDRYLRAHKEMDGAWSGKGETPEEETLNAAAKLQACNAYKAAFARWKRITEERRMFTLEAATAGALAVGLGGETPLEVGLRVNRTYGMPVIPGSAIKGLCRAVAQGAGLDPASEQFAALFGDQKHPSLFVFWDAWYDPASPDKSEGQPFHRDVVTVHHPEYYRSAGEKGWPTDFDDPTPVPFLVVKPNTRFLFAVSCPDARWNEYLRSLLTWALTTRGIGAKKNAGYGRFSVKQAPPPPAEVREECFRQVQVTRNRSPLWFRMTIAGRSVSVEGRTADSINVALGKDFRDRLRKRPTFLADVTATVQGDRITVTKIVPIESA